MSDLLDQLKSLLHSYGTEIDATRKTLVVKNMSCLENVPSSPGVYWIETTMPVEVMRVAISKTSMKDKKVRAKPPKGTALIIQESKNLYTAYSGTEDNLQKRLKQHLFNLGSEGTARLGCEIHSKPFSEYKWQVRYAEIERYEVRYAIESWWRLNKGWPIFCLR